MPVRFKSFLGATPTNLKYHAPDTPIGAGPGDGPVCGERRMVTFYRPESHRALLRPSRQMREASVDQVLLRLLLHLGAGLQVGKPAH